MKWLVLIVCTLLAAQTVADTGVLQPPRKGLVALHWPDATKLEVSVREQITALQNELTATANNPKTSDVTLSEAYGKLGQIYHAYSLVSSARDCYLNASVLAPRDFSVDLSGGEVGPAGGPLRRRDTSLPVGARNAA
jgi:cytochrome c-type biogenesis protein CcmH/NrfG